jgi:hypothetical protein
MLYTVVSGNNSRWALMAGILQGQNESKYKESNQTVIVDWNKEKGFN